MSALSADVEQVVQALRVGSIRDEEDFTSQMLSSIRSGLGRLSMSGLTWTSMVLKRQTEEPAIGADFLGVLRLRLPDYSVDKGFLAQAKMAGPRRRINATKLLAQSRAMLSRSPESYVFLYKPSGVVVVPAIAVVAAGGEPRELGAWSLAEFFAEHFRCFVGDRALAMPSQQTIQSLVEEAPARHMLLLGAAPYGEDPWRQETAG